MRAMVVLLLVATLLPPAAAEQRAEVVDGEFPPEAIVASEWETVRWAWPANQTHGLVDAETGEMWCEPTREGCVHFFPTQGSYRYHCPIHPEMTGRVLVERRSADAAVPLHASFRFEVDGLTVRFDASRAAQSRTAIESFVWDFGDGTNGTGRLAQHTYAAPATYVVRLTITDEFGSEDTDGRRVDLALPGHPEAFFWTNGSARSVLFEALPREGAHAWDFGDGSRVACAQQCEETADTIAASPTSLVHVYRRGGHFLVNHTVDDLWATRAVSVLASETFEVTSEGLTIVANASALPHYGNASYAWLFGDVEVASGAVVEHTFPQAGLWSIALTLEDEVGAQTIEREVVVSEDAPDAERAVLVSTERAGTTDERATPQPLGIALLALLAALFLNPERYK